MYNIDRLPQLSRILKRFCRIETIRKSIFQANNPHYVLMGATSLTFLQPWEAALQTKLLDEVVRLETERDYTNRGITHTQDFKEYNRLVCKIARTKKLSRRELRTCSLPQLRNLASVEQITMQADFAF